MISTYGTVSSAYRFIISAVSTIVSADTIAMQTY